MWKSCTKWKWERLIPIYEGKKVGKFGWEKVAKNWQFPAIVLRYGRFPEIDTECSEKCWGKTFWKTRGWFKKIKPFLTNIDVYHHILLKSPAYMVENCSINLSGSFVKIRCERKMRWLFKRKCSEKLDVNKLWTIDVKTLVNW